MKQQAFFIEAWALVCFFFEQENICALPGIVKGPQICNLKSLRPSPAPQAKSSPANCSSRSVVLHWSVSREGYSPVPETTTPMGSIHVPEATKKRAQQHERFAGTELLVWEKVASLVKARQVTGEKGRCSKRHGCRHCLAYQHSTLIPIYPIDQICWETSI